MNFNQKVWEITKKIPKGKVSTYGEIATKLGNPRLARQVGWALHANGRNSDSSNVPCHRVVNREGRLAPNFAFDGADEQRKRLEVEGVKFVNKTHVDLEASLWVLNK
ncbi:MAG: MGMT family protein [Candidatus Curtissbacteria bacterium]|nr:MGMT family protein [Candidatus Curtissbacteria bacterium]